ncbi:MAG: penicillin-binding protein [Bacteroidetes bacterium]|nr:MAG: penicillin-binding protein [Bacteroidota bacterium]
MKRHPWFTGVGTFLLCLLPGFYLAVLLGAFGPLPGKQALRQLRTDQASEVFAANGQLIGKYYLEDRNDIPYEELAPDLVMALLATEDVRFYQHAGIDTRSLLRVLFKSVILQDKSAGGGSTLSQQLAKNFFPRQSYPLFSLLINKCRELIIARRLEEVYEKEQILAMYLNTMSFGENAYGISVAARRYFNTTPDALRIEQAALLVGLLKAPTMYNPRLHPQKALQRRNLVLSQMSKYEYISQQEADSLSAIPLQLNYYQPTHNDGIAPYFREFLRLELNQWCKTHVKADGSHYDIYRDGLKIYTSIDPRMQRYAEAAVQEEMKRLQGIFDRAHRGKPLSSTMKQVVDLAMRRSHRYRSLYKQGKSSEQIRAVFDTPVPMQLFTWEGVRDTLLSPLDSVIYYQYFLHAGLMAMEPQTGLVRAWVGGINHRFFQYDHVTARRQTGSIFKPIVFAAALEKGISPCTYISNEKESLRTYTSWVPRNADNLYGGEYSMQGALIYSVNIAAVNLMYATGRARVIQTAKNLGVSSELPNVASLALGTADISLYDMLSVYGTLANRGKACKPIFVEKIEDRYGNVIHAPFKQTNQQQVLKTETADQLIYMLQQVVEQGTARGLRTRYKLNNDIAGKTGTTQNQVDGWFMGAMPGLVAGAWVGADDRRVHFRTMTSGQGARTAMPIWARFVQKLNADPAYKELTTARFPTLSPRLKSELDCQHFIFLNNMNDFKTWWQAQQEQQ